MRDASDNVRYTITQYSRREEVSQRRRLVVNENTHKDQQRFDISTYLSSVIFSAVLHVCSLQFLLHSDRGVRSNSLKKLLQRWYCCDGLWSVVCGILARIPPLKLSWKRVGGKKQLCKFLRRIDHFPNSVF
jgi:hypothetical protein